jgi:hypothetical protein
MIDTDTSKTNNQHAQFKCVSFKTSERCVVEIMPNITKPATIDKVKNLFLNGFDLKQLSLVLAVNI